MKHIGITGGNGFIGNHLLNTLYLNKDKYKVSILLKENWDNEKVLEKFITDCDVIIHLAALNRHHDNGIILDTNLNLNTKLIQALKNCNAKNKQVIFSSSTQEFNNSVYGESKKIGRQVFIDWAIESGNKFVGLVIPNVFGPFGKPFYNSVIATFSHQILNGLKPEIDNDKLVDFIYVGDLISKIVSCIDNETNDYELKILHTFSMYVSALLQKFSYFNEYYIENGNIPLLHDKNERDLFNTFRSYNNLDKYFPKPYIEHTDNRGSFVELIKSDGQGQVSFSTTKPGITRGNHFHTRKIERFSVIKGNAVIKMRKIGTSEILEFNVSGDFPVYIDMPIWFTHSISNVGVDELLTIFWINEYYDPNDADTYFENVLLN